MNVFKNEQIIEDEQEIWQIIIPYGRKDEEKTFDSQTNERIQIMINY